MNQINTKKLGLTLGSFVAFIHLVWVILLWLGIAQPLMDFAYRMHSMPNPYALLPFNLGNSILLIIIAFIMGNIIGNIFGFFWNKFYK